MRDLDGMAAVVTGGTRGIGRSIVETLLAEGARVVLAGRSRTDVDAASNELLRMHPNQVVGVTADVRHSDDARRMIDSAVSAFGRLDILINNAGVGVFGAVETMDDDSWRSQIDTNLTGVFLCCRAAIPHLKTSSGWIINIGSLAGRNAFAGGAAYNASKFGLIGFTEALMLEVRHDGIRVSCVMPGSVATGFGGSPAEAEWKLQPEDIALVVRDLLRFPARALPSRVEIRPSMPPQA